MEADALSQALDSLNAAAAALRDARLSVEQAMGAAESGAGGASGLAAASGDSFVLHLAILVLAALVGWLAVRGPGPERSLLTVALLGAVSAVVLVAALPVVAVSATGLATTLGFAALVLAGAGLFGGFVAAWRLLAGRRNGRE